ncbi:hypothetical protein [Achromobacter arsenitoxydans]|uniref:Uncharacterized protein n=1 Tax=Achromobacter arsenitoxydans SY8 TaxID=477184 RepID=H0F9L7_9BURK|nr:hypothetical protein [Achromobacter arsenitoxydans]EHK65282.1 hypothetical protein KYC_17347 [Achromobacter arsenitoxydans SY8]
MEASGHNTAAPARKQPGANGFKYKPRFGVIVLCDDESHQQRVFDELRAQGYRLKVVAV